MIRIALIFTLVSAAAAAQAPTPAAAPSLEQKHENLFATMDHLAVSFTQTVYRKMRNKTFERSGQAFFSKPARFRWIFDDKNSDGEEYYFNGESLAHFQKKDNMVTYYSTKTGLVNDLQEIVDLVLDSRKLLGRYDAKDVVTEKNNSSFRLVPKVSGDIKEIGVKVSDERKYVKEVKFEYSDGNYSLFRFKNPRTKDIDPGTYEFVNPGTVKVKKLG